MVMGIFSKKKNEPDYDSKDCSAKKKRIREIFNERVEDGDTYEVIYAYMTTSKFEHGFVFDTNTTTFYYYIVGYRKSDFSMIFIQIDNELSEHSTAFIVEKDKIVNVSYNPKYCQLCFEYEKKYGSFGELLNIGDTDRKTVYGPKNIYQAEERENFLDFAEEFRAKLQQEGYKLDKWKR